MIRILAILCAALVMVGGFAAQEWSPLAAGPVLYPDVIVTGVTAAEADDGYMLTVRGWLADGCDMPLLAESHLKPGTLEIEIAPQGEQGACVPGAEPVPFEIDVLVPEVEIDEMGLAIVANDYAATLLLDEAGAPLIGPALRAYSYVESVAVDGAALRLRGAHPDGCQLETLTALAVDAELKRITADVYRVLPGMLFACPAVLQTFDMTVDLPADLTGVYHIRAGEQSLFYDFEAAAFIDAQTLSWSMPAQIEEPVAVAVVEDGADYAVNLYVTGLLTAGCAYPVLVEQARDEDRIEVRIAQNLPTDIMCPRMVHPYAETIRLDGLFAPGEYAVQVNDVMVTVVVPAGS